MLFRVVVGIVLASAIATAQPRIERSETMRVPGGPTAQAVTDPDTRGTIVPVNGRRTTIVRLDTEEEAVAQGFTRSQLASFGIFASGGAIASAIVGFARDSAANVLPSIEMQLRDLGGASVVAQTGTNAGGQFAFSGLPAGTYIVELLSREGRVLALSDVVSVGPGEVVHTIVQLPSPKRSFAAWFGSATTAAVNSAVEAGVLALEAGPSVSPES